MLRKVNFVPGFNKQLTPSGVEAGWVGGDYTRFRYGMPEKIGGWEETQTDILPGAGRKLFGWFDTQGNRWIAVGTNKILAISSGFIFQPVSMATTLSDLSMYPTMMPCLFV